MYKGEWVECQPMNYTKDISIYLIKVEKIFSHHLRFETNLNLSFCSLKKFSNIIQLMSNYIYFLAHKCNVIEM